MAQTGNRQAAKSSECVKKTYRYVHNRFRFVSMQWVFSTYTGMNLIFFLFFCLLQNILEKFNPGTRQMINAGKAYLKALHGRCFTLSSAIKHNHIKIIITSKKRAFRMWVRVAIEQMTSIYCNYDVGYGMILFLNIRHWPYFRWSSLIRSHSLEKMNAYEFFVETIIEYYAAN